MELAQSDLFWRRCDTLCPSGFVDDVTFSHNDPIACLSGDFTSFFDSRDFNQLLLNYKDHQVLLVVSRTPSGAKFATYDCLVSPMVSVSATSRSVNASSGTSFLTVDLPDWTFIVICRYNYSCKNNSTGQSATLTATAAPLSSQIYTAPLQMIPHSTALYSLDEPNDLSRRLCRTPDHRLMLPRPHWLAEKWDKNRNLKKNEKNSKSCLRLTGIFIRNSTALYAHSKIVISFSL